MAKTIKMTANVFIVPNNLIKVSDEHPNLQLRDCKFAKELFDINNIEYDARTFDLVLVQLWWVSTTEEYPSDNIGDHGIVIDGKLYRPGVDNLPTILFAGKIEGDTFSLKVPCGDIIIDFTVTLAQKQHRYRNYGNFESLFTHLHNNLSIPLPTNTPNDEVSFDSNTYSPRDLINYYEEVMKETVLSLSRVQEKADKTLAAIPTMHVDAFEAEDKNNMEYLVREISAMLDTVKASTNRKIKTAIGKRAECDKYNALCKRYWGGEE